MTIIFNGGGGPWIGHYDPSIAFDFSALIGNCKDPAFCTYDDIVEGNGAILLNSTIGWEAIDPVGLGEMHAIADGLRSWTVTGNLEDPTERGGTYCVVGVDAGCVAAVAPEPSALWLLLTGSLSLLWMKPKG